MVAFYLDTSALAKLVVEEPETAALRQWMHGVATDQASSDLARTELIRLARQLRPDLVMRAREVLDGLILLEVTTAIFERAALLDPTILRSLDAVHLAVALELGDDLGGIVTYDSRLASASAANGVPVVAPA